MAELHENLTYLDAVEWDEVPQDQEELSKYMKELFTAGELMINSVPSPPNGSTFDQSEPHFKTPNAAKSAKDMHTSTARCAPLHAGHASLQKNWGKPQKFSKKDNPLDVALYKMAGHDRHGAWFARHNVLEGLSFSKFKRAMKREFPETLLTQGAPGAGAKRGLSADRRVEKREVEGVGHLEVYQLSGQMPPPVSPRDFLTLLLTTDDALTHKSAAEVQDGSKYVPRHFMVVSKSITHGDAPHQQGFVRATYQSVELIREIPLHACNGDQTDPELNPVEWIMVTRSDPAGGIPRFLVDRGTPDAMLGDVSKFLNWACSQEYIPDPEEDADKQKETSDENTAEIRRQSTADLAPPVALANGDTTPREASTSTVGTATENQEPGLVKSLTNNLQAGVNQYAPASVSSFVNNQIEPAQEELSDSTSSSDESYLSAEEMKRMSTAPEHPARDSAENLSIASGTSEISKSEKKNLNTHEKEVLKISQKRENLEQKLARRRQAEEEKLKQSQEKDETEQAKAKERMDREMQKREEKHKRDLEKLEAKRENASKKAEQKRRKKDDQNKISLVARERDELRSHLDLLRKENNLLTDQVEHLQRENTALATKLGKVGGPDVLKSVQDEVGTTPRSRSRAGTSASKMSGLSAESAATSLASSAEKKVA